MKKRPMARIALASAAALLGLTIAPVLTAAAAGAAPLGGSGAYTCTGGDVPPGSYNSILITGVCFAPVGTIVVRGNLTVAPGALLDAVTPGDPPKPKQPVVPATVLVGGNVLVGKNAVLALGCSPNISCSNPPGISFDRVRGNLTALNSQAVVIHSATIGGSVTIAGGGGGAAGGANSGACFTAPIPAPWSEAPGLVAGGPQYNDLEDSFVGGNLIMAGVQTCWLGSLRNQVRGSVAYLSNVTSDPDGMEVNNNLIGGNMACKNNDPAVQFGDGGAAPNLVGGFASGECGFDVVLPNTGPNDTPGYSEHISVSLRSLNTYAGAHAAKHVASLPPVTTTSGYVITADLNNFKLTGTGLTGSGTVNLSAPPGTTGEALLATAKPNGSKSFIAYDACDTCKLGTQAGSTTLRFYGTTTPNGLTYGTFLVTSGGAGHGGLSTLAGWGTFTSAGQPHGVWRLVEHLRIT